MKPFISVTVVSLVLYVAGCSQQTSDDVGKAIDSGNGAAPGAMSDAGEAASETADSAKDTAGTTVEAAKVVTDDAVDEAMERIDEGMAAATERATAALAGIERGPETLKNVTDFFDSANEALRGISDTETAKAAVAKLTELNGSLEGVSDSVRGLPAEAQTALAGVIQQGTAGLNLLSEKANAIPGVKEILQPQLDEITQKLSALTEKE